MDQLIRIPRIIDYVLSLLSPWYPVSVVDQRIIETVAQACLFVARTHGTSNPMFPVSDSPKICRIPSMSRELFSSESEAPTGSRGQWSVNSHLTNKQENLRHGPISTD